MASAPWGTLPEPLIVSSTAPWIDSVAFVDADEAPVAIVLPLRVGLRSAAKPAGYHLLLTEDELQVSGHIGTWTVPVERMRTLAPGDYTIEITAGANLAKRVQLRGTVQVVAGIVP